MYLAVLLMHVVVSLTLVTFIFLQHGKGADAGVTASFSSGSSSQNQNMGMTKMLAILAVVFFATSLALGFLSSHNQQVGTQVHADPQTTDATETPSVEKKHTTA